MKGAGLEGRRTHVIDTRFRRKQLVLHDCIGRRIFRACRREE